MIISKAYPIAKRILSVFLLAGLVAFALPAEAAKDEKRLDQKLGKWLFGAEPMFFSMPTFHVPIIRDGKIISHMNIRITVETLGHENRDKVIEKRQKLYSAFLRDLHGVMAFRYRSGLPFDPKAVKVRLLKIAHQIHGKGVVKDVLIDRIFDRKVR